METTGYQFSSIDECNKFLYSSQTDKSNFFADKIKTTIKIVQKEDCIYYDTNTKLWIQVSKNEFKTFVFNWFNETTKHMKTLYKEDDKMTLETIDKYSKTIANCTQDLEDTSLAKFKTNNAEQQNKSKQLLAEFEKKVSTRDKLLSTLDHDGFIETIIKRAMGKLIDSKILQLLDNDPNNFPILGGKKINLKTGKISNRSQSDYFTFESPVSYVKNRKHAEKFFLQLMPDEKEREHLRKVLGYFLTGDITGRCFFAFYGVGSNGKTTLCNLLQLILKPFYHQCDKTIFVKTNNMGATPQKAALLGKRLVVYSEGDTADDMDINFSSLKEISGDDPINARELYKSPFVFKAQCKLVMLSNYVLPMTAEKAVKNRLRYVFFNQEFQESKKSKEFVDSLKTKYLSEIFSWIVDGSVEYYSDLKIEMPESFQNRTDQLLLQEDSIESFLKNKIIKTNNEKDFMRKGELFEYYKSYCNDNSQRCQPRSTLFNRLSHCKWEIKKKDGYDGYRGFKINNNTDIEINDSIVIENDKDSYIKKLQYQIKKLQNLIDVSVNETNVPPAQSKAVKIKKKKKIDEDDDDLVLTLL